MKAEDILLALGEIDETLPPECTQPVRKKPIPWKGIASAAACIAAVILSTVFLHHVGMLGRHVGMFGIIHSEPESETETTEWIVWETVTESNTEETQAAEPVMQGGSNNYYPTTRRSSTPKTTVARTRVDRCDVHHAAQMQKVRHHRRQPQQTQLCARHL